MKYDDDELAEAALLIAHTPDAGPMPAELEERILGKAPAIATEVRFSTTKGAAVAVEAPTPIGEGRPRSGVSAWAGWLAAAACFAFAIYEWRSAGLRHGVEPARVTATQTLELRDPTGRVRGGVVCDADGSECRLTITELPTNADGEQYRLWLSGSDAERAVAVGALTCTAACVERELRVPQVPGLQRVNAAWITHERADGSAPSLDVARVVLGSARR
jgi:hypothetical protein